MSEGAAGYLDLHIHGAFGIDVLTAAPAELDRLALGLAARGVEAFLPTLVPMSLPALRDAVARLSGWMASRTAADGRGARPLGLHFEGPFVSPARAGALHRECLLDGADDRKVDAFFSAAGAPPGRPMVTLAPEIPGGEDLVREFVRRGFVVAIGHTEANVPELERAAALGARHMTHFGNAMKPFSGKPRTIVITAPAAGAEVSNLAPLQGTISITPFENNLAYRVYQNGKLIGAGPILVRGEMGAPGAFDTKVEFKAQAPGPASIQVLDQDAATGFVIADAWVDVTAK